MTQAAPPVDPKGMPPLVRNYSLLAVASLVIMALLLASEGGPGVWGLLPVLVGLIGLLTRWPAAPVFVLLTILATLVIVRQFTIPLLVEQPPGLLGDMLLAMCMLAYSAAHMRLVTLTRHSLPPDPRRKRRTPGRRVVGRWLLPQPPARRTAWQGNAGELMALLASVPLFAIVATLLWVRLVLDMTLSQGVRGQILPDVVWQAVLVIWVVAVAILCARAFLAYLARAQASPEESLMYLNDQLWDATRGEQARINRWLAWARLRARQKEEKR
jgi:hypothetical protein